MWVTYTLRLTICVCSHVAHVYVFACAYVFSCEYVCLVRDWFCNFVYAYACIMHVRPYVFTHLIIRLHRRVHVNCMHRTVYGHVHIRSVCIWTFHWVWINNTRALKWQSFNKNSNYLSYLIKRKEMIAWYQTSSFINYERYRISSSGFY